MPAAKKERPCFFCDGTSQRCRCCGESSAVCEGDCDEEHGGLIDCDECKGTGVASADLPPDEPKKRRRK